MIIWRFDPSKTIDFGGGLLSTTSWGHDDTYQFSVIYDIGDHPYPRSVDLSIGFEDFIMGDSGRGGS